MGYRIAVVGATGNVGREMLKTLAERQFPVREVVALASERSIGREVSFGDDDVLKIFAVGISPWPVRAARFRRNLPHERLRQDAWLSITALIFGWIPMCRWWCQR